MPADKLPLIFRRVVSLEGDGARPKLGQLFTALIINGSSPTLR